ncbi:MAG TPA: ThuA domain-containing protein [Burkholderiales bacterium]
MSALFWESFGKRTAILLLVLSGLAPVAPASAEDDPAFAVLVFSRTAGFRHDSIAAGIDAIQAIGAQDGFRVDASEDAGVFTDANLSKYRVVIFLSTTGEILNSAQQAAFQGFIRRGGGFVGIHSATDTAYDWPWFGALVGNYFRRHPAIQSATLKVVDASHPSTRHLPIDWKRRDEWYDFRDAFAADLTILMRIDETTYSGGRMGTNHPMAWYHAYDGGRAWYTALGHTIASWSEPLFLDHVRGGIAWAAGLAPE